MDSLDALDKSLDNLETVLAPLLDKSLPETLEKLDLLQKAKLQVLLPYVVNDLVFIYLKTRGINTKTHPVVKELDRIKQYFDKIKNAEDPEKRRFLVDQAAATRFIKHAIKESQDELQRNLKQDASTRLAATNPVAGPSQDTVPPSSMTEAALAKIQARDAASREDISSEENELEVFVESAPPEPTVESTESSKGKSKANNDTTVRNNKRRGMDPWAGYDENDSGPPTPVDASTGKQGRKRARKGSRPATATNSEAPQTGGIIGGMENAPHVEEPKKSERVVTGKTSSIKKSPKKTNKNLEIIDVDGVTPEASGSQGTPTSQPMEVIDVDALDSSPGITVQEKKRKRKKKKPTP